MATRSPRSASGATNRCPDLHREQAQVGHAKVSCAPKVIVRRRRLIERGATYRRPRNNHTLNEPPKRPPLLIAVALLVMAGCVFVAGNVAILLADNYPFARVVGGIYLVFPIVVGVTQYFAVFRRNELATRVAAGVLLFLCAAYGVMGLFEAAGVMGLAAIRTSWPDGLAILAIATFLGWSAWKNYKWRFALRAHYKTTPAPPSRWQISLTEILGATMAVALAAAIASYKISNLPKP
jgi:hypothetical protein